MIDCNRSKISFSRSFYEINELYRLLFTRFDFLASRHSDELSNIKEIADTYSISKNHLMKVIYRLGQLGYVETIRGRGGGIRLGMTPEDINIGEVVRHTEDDFNIVECFDSKKISVSYLPPAT